MYIMMFLYLICSIVYLFLGIITFFKDKKSLLNQAFLLICLDLFFWAFCLALMSATHDSEIATFFRVIASFSWSFLYALILLFIILLTEKNKYLKSPIYYVCLFIPAIISIYLYVFDPVTGNDIVKISVGWAFKNPLDKGMLWDVYFNIYYVAYMIIVFGLLLMWHKKTSLKRQKKQSRIIITTMIMTFVLGSIVDIIFPILEIKLVPPLTIFMILSVISGIAYSMIKYGLMTITNEKVVSDIFKVMNEGLIIFDHENNIIAVNQGALNMLQYEESDLINKDINMLFKDENISEKFVFNTSNELEILMKSQDTIPILASYSNLLDDFGDCLGNLIIFQDLTKYKKIQNELKSAYDELDVKVNDRTKELKNANLKLGMEIKMRIDKEKQIEQLAYNDQLTGLPNRRSFNLQLENSILKAQMTNDIFAVLFLDLDGFKMINDTLGHDHGDILLKNVAKRLSNLFRKSDLVSRVGGDEFIILINNISHYSDIKNMCENVINDFNKPYSLQSGDIYTTTSIGVAIYPNDGSDTETLVKNADISMYKAKESGKGKYLFYSDTMIDNLDQTLRLTNDLHKAIELNELEVYYQPQNNTFTEEIIGMEALLRWNHPMFGIISPLIIIPIAERTGLIMEIGEWVLNRACSDFKKLRSQNDKVKTIAVNLSVNQVVNYSFIDQVKKALLNNDLDPKYLELEITESILLDNPDYICKILNELKDFNIRIAVDDFGTDYSSLKYLKQLPLNRIKIAKNFIDGIGNNNIDESIIASIIHLGKNLKLNLIAEGVEEKEQLDFLRNLECDEIQGFYFYEPMRFKDIEMLLSESYKIESITREEVSEIRM